MCTITNHVNDVVPNENNIASLVKRYPMRIRSQFTRRRSSFGRSIPVEKVDLASTMQLYTEPELTIPDIKFDQYIITPPELDAPTEGIPEQTEAILNLNAEKLNALNLHSDKDKISTTTQKYDTSLPDMAIPNIQLFEQRDTIEVQTLPPMQNITEDLLPKEEQITNNSHMEDNNLDQLDENRLVENNNQNREHVDIVQDAGQKECLVDDSEEEDVIEIESFTDEDVSKEYTKSLSNQPRERTHTDNVRVIRGPQAGSEANSDSIVVEGSGNYTLNANGIKVVEQIPTDRYFQFIVNNTTDLIPLIFTLIVCTIGICLCMLYMNGDSQQGGFLPLLNILDIGNSDIICALIRANYTRLYKENDNLEYRELLNASLIILNKNYNCKLYSSRLIAGKFNIDDPTDDELDIIDDNNTDAKNEDENIDDIIVPEKEPLWSALYCFNCPTEIDNFSNISSWDEDAQSITIFPYDKGTLKTKLTKEHRYLIPLDDVQITNGDTLIVAAADMEYANQIQVYANSILTKAQRTTN